MPDEPMTEDQLSEIEARQHTGDGEVLLTENHESPRVVLALVAEVRRLRGLFHEDGDGGWKCADCDSWEDTAAKSIQRAEAAEWERDALAAKVTLLLDHMLTRPDGGENTDVMCHVCGSSSDCCPEECPAFADSDAEALVAHEKRRREQG